MYRPVSEEQKKVKGSFFFPKGSLTEFILVPVENYRIYICSACGALYIPDRPDVENCSKCGKTFNIYFNPPTFSNHKCDNSFLTKRSDDNEEIIKRRYETYLNETFPLLEFYKINKQLHKINGNMEIHQISKQIQDILASING